jgi:hypothetical protein
LPLQKCYDRTTDFATTTSFHILSNSSLPVTMSFDTVYSEPCMGKLEAGNSRSKLIVYIWAFLLRIETLLKGRSDGVLIIEFDLRNGIARSV